GFVDTVARRPKQDFAAVIFWGDGTAPTLAKVGETSKGVVYVVGTHRYTHSGTFRVTVVIGSREGGHGVAARTAKVARSAAQGMQVSQRTVAVPIAIAPATAETVHDMALHSFTASRKRRT